MIQDLSNTPVANAAAAVSVGPHGKKQKANSKQQHFKVFEPDLPRFEFTARWIETAAELEELVDPWNRLSETALHANPFFDADFLIPAMNSLSDENTRVLAIEAPHRRWPDGPRVLCGLMPLVRRQFYGFPLSCYEIWKHDQCFDCTPLLRRDCAAEVLEYCFDSLVRESKAKLFSMNTISGEGDFQRVLTDVLRKRNATLFHRDAFTRASFVPAENATAYINAKVSASTRKNTQRLERKLNGIGDVAISLSQPFDDHRQWSEEFIALEASGWKGEINTSFGSNPNQRRFFEELTRRSLPEGGMSFLKVTLDGRPIAMLCDLHSSNVAAHFKTTFAESHAEYSPGLIAELHNIHRLHDSNVTRMDSCADPDHSMINRVWPDRVRMESMVVALGGRCSQLATAAMPTIQILGKTFKRGENK